MDKTKIQETLSHIRIPADLADETKSEVEAQLGIKISASAAVEWALRNHFLRENMFCAAKESGE